MNIDYIENILKQLDTLYQQQSELPNDNQTIPLALICKMATLELCGWLEDVFDKWIVDYKTHHLNMLPKAEDGNRLYDKYREYLNGWNKKITDTVSKTHGFSYHQHLRKLLAELLGPLYLIHLENQIGLDEIERFSHKLDILYEKRNILAHQSYPNIIKQRQSLDIPSIILGDFHEISPILKKFDHHLKTMKLTFVIDESN